MMAHTNRYTPALVTCKFSTMVLQSAPVVAYCSLRLDHSYVTPTHVETTKDRTTRCYYYSSNTYNADEGRVDAPPVATAAVGPLLSNRCFMKRG